MPGHKRLAGALAVVAMAVAISACGSSSSDQTIDQADANKLISQLNAVQDAVDSRDCKLAKQRADEFVNTVNELPDTVGTDDKERLRNAGVNLEKLADDPSQCNPQQTTGATGLQGDATEGTTATPTVPTTSPTTTTAVPTTTTEPEPSGNGGGNEGNGGGPPSGTGGGPPSGTGGGPPSGTGGGPPTGGGGGDTGGGGGAVGGGGSGGTGGTGTGGIGGTGGGTGGTG